MDLTTPRADGLHMPAEWAEHECCLMAWPSRESLWGSWFNAAKNDYATVARAIQDFEPVLMVCRPGDAAEVRDLCGSAISIEELPIDDSWTRDSGPLFVTDGVSRRAVVSMRFNGWGNKYQPHGNDDRLAANIARLLELPLYQAPLTSEGGAYFVDGEGTLITTVGSVLNDNRNPGVTREQAENILRDYLGADRIIWLDAFPDRDTDGHIDGIAQYVAPGVVALQVPDDHDNELYDFAVRNIASLTSSPDANGRTIDVKPVAPLGVTALAGTDTEIEIPYLNFYLPNGGVIMPTGDERTDEIALTRLREVFPDREVVGVPGTLLSYGGGGPHCITQQIPRL